MDIEKGMEYEEYSELSDDVTESQEVEAWEPLEPEESLEQAIQDAELDDLPVEQAEEEELKQKIMICKVKLWMKIQV